MLFDTVSEGDEEGGVRMANSPMHIDDIKQRLMSDDVFSPQERCEAYPLVFLNGYMVTDSYNSDEHQQLCAEP